MCILFADKTSIKIKQKKKKNKLNNLFIVPLSLRPFGEFNVGPISLLCDLYRRCCNIVQPKVEK